MDIDTTNYLFLITGAPGSGKSTFAKHLKAVSEFSKLIKPITNIFEADSFFIKNNEYKFDPTKLYYAHKDCQIKTETAMKYNKNIIVSNTNIRPRDRKIYFELAKKYNYKIFYKHLTGEYDNIHNVPIEKVKQMRANYVKLTDAEKALIMKPEEYTIQFKKFLQLAI